jgi:uncharacterized protein (DUF885 family)
LVISRRHVLLASCALRLAACAHLPHPEKHLPESSTPQETELDAVLTQMLESQLGHSPETATRLGLDTGARAGLRHRLDGRTQASAQAFVSEQEALLNRLSALDASQLSRMGRHNRSVVMYEREALLTQARQFSFGIVGDSLPYVLSPLTGAYQSVPDFLQSSHPVENEADALAYLARLQAFAEVLDDETQQAEADAAQGVTPPDFAIDATLHQLRELRQQEPQACELVTSLVQRAAAKNLPGDWHAQASQLVRAQVYPALDRQIALLQQWRPRARHEAGVWCLPGGEAYYRQAIRLQTTTLLSAAEIHQTGEEQVSALTVEMDGLLRAQGLAEGTVAQRLAALAEDKRFVYSNTEAGRAQLLADLQRKVQALESSLPLYFNRLPTGRLDIRRVPAAIQAGAPRGYYQAGSIDGRAPGALYVNLRDTAEWKRWYLPTFAFHEGVPGHHLQGSLALEASGLATLRKLFWFAGYGEGWALYAEQLADEMGAYEGDPFGRLGYLQSMLFRAARLVADTGLHALRWSHERAVDYMVQATGEPRSRMAAEVARYCVMPAQALSYKVGHNHWNALRDLSRRQLGTAFDVREFHAVCLMSGAVPLEVLTGMVSDWTTRGPQRAP